MPPSPGWYPDPAAPSAGWRWWDGSQWTAATAPSGYPAYSGYPGGVQGPDIEGERNFAKWAKRGLVGIAIGQVVSTATFASSLHTFKDVFSNLDANGGTTVTPKVPPAAAIAQPLSWLATAGLIVFVVWVHRASTNAMRLGYRLPRSPGWAAAGFFIPIVNFWWPYQSTKALLPEGDPRRRHAGWWFAGFLVGAFASLGAAALLAFVSVPVGLAALLVTLLAEGAMVLNGQALVDASCEAHATSMGN